MKKERRYRRFDPLSTLAVLGCIAVLLFESFFIFELYHLKLAQIKPAQIKQYMAETVEPHLSRWGFTMPVPAEKPEPLIQIIPEVGESAPAETDVAPAEVEEPVELDPVG